MVELPKHHIYVEITGARSSFFLHKPTSPNDIVVDKNNIIYDLYRHILNDDGWSDQFPSDSFLDKWLTEHSTYDPIPKFILPSKVIQLGEQIPQLPNIYKHILRLQLEVGLPHTIVKRYTSPRTLFYCDYTNIREEKLGDKFATFKELQASNSNFIFRDQWNPNYHLPKLIDGTVELRRFI